MFLCLNKMVYKLNFKVKKGDFKCSNERLVEKQGNGLNNLLQKENFGKIYVRIMKVFFIAFVFYMRVSEILQATSW